MTESTSAGDFEISVVIPALNAQEHLPALLKSIEAQGLRPKEIVIVDSSPSAATAELVGAWQGPIPIVFQRLKFAYPGHARNVGVGLAKGEWIAFIDCRTVPRTDWLESAVAVAQRTGAHFVPGSCVGDADTGFKRILRAATYGWGTMRTLPGSLVLKSVFVESGGFAPNVRSGEDVEWIHRLETAGVPIESVASPTITYYGFVGSLSEAIRKWYAHAVASAYIEVVNNHKKLYLLVFVCLIVFAAFRWNVVVASGYIGSIYYLPNVTKISIAAIFSAYFLYRGIVRPLQFQVKPEFLFPWRWLYVGFVGMCLDLAKAPGLLWGAVLLLARRVGSLRAYLGKSASRN